MEPKRWEQIQAVFFDAIELPRSERAAFVRERAADDEQLALEVLRMLDAHESATGFVEPPSPADIEARINPRDYLTGQVIGDYELQEELGRGGMGIVYRARQVSLDRIVAVKVLPPALAASVLRLERFRREAHIASLLKHPGLASVLTFGEEDGLVYYAMQLIEGPCLADLVRAARSGKPFDGPTQVVPGDPKSCATMAAALLDVLEHVHQSGMVHRDVKPENLMLSPNGPILIDFGLAKDLEVAGLTGTGEAAGTLPYMSPEQVRASTEEIDGRTDIYSAGAVLYELLTLAPPFSGAPAAEMFHKITSVTPSSLRRSNRRVPRPLELIVMKALRKDPAERYATAADMAADLRRFLAKEPVLAKPPTLAQRTRRLAVKRRALLVALPLVVIAGLVGRYLMPVHAEERSLATFDLSACGYDELELEATPYADEFGALRGEPEHRRTISNGDSLRLSEGLWSLQLVAADGTSWELIRAVGLNTAFDLVPPRRLASWDDRGMARVPAGVAQLGMRPDPVTDQFDKRPLEVASFELDQVVVTNADYRRFVEESGLEAPANWRKRGLDGGQPPDRTDWEELPATGLSRDQMRVYAESIGKRLPTMAEWTLAMQPTHAAWIADGRSSDSNLAPGEDSSGSGSVDFGMYVEFARPALDPNGPVDPYALHNPFGNVGEMLEGFVTLGGIGSDETIPLPAEMRALPMAVHKGLFWADGKLFAEDRGVDRLTPIMADNGSPEIGFRCARSIPPAPDSP